MPKGKSLTLSEEAAIGLFFIQRYRFLTIDQFARVACLNRTTASHQLRFFELAGMLGHFGNAKLGRVAGKFVRNYTLSSNPFQFNRVQANYAKFSTRCCGIPEG